MKRYLLLFFFFYSYLFSQDNYLLALQKSKNIHLQDIQKDKNETNSYYKEILKSYKQSIQNNFQSLRLSEGYKYVYYDITFTQRVIIDFRNGFIYIDILADGEKEAAQKTLEAFEKLISFDLDSIVKNNYIEQKLAIKKQRVIKKVENKLLFIGMLYSKAQIHEIENHLIEKQYNSIKLKEKSLFSTRLDLPKHYEKDYTRYYKKYIKKYVQKYDLEESYIWALIENESGFNPYQDSNQKYGLMQISPFDASIAYHSLRGIYKSFYVEDLFDVETNLDLSSNYLSTLFKNEFKEITDTINKGYIVLLVYHYGLDDILKSLRMKTKIELISLANFTSSDKFYKYLMKKLPREKRQYFFRLTQDIKKYK